MIDPINSNSIDQEIEFIKNSTLQSRVLGKKYTMQYQKQSMSLETFLDTLLKMSQNKKITDNEVREILQKIQEKIPSKDDIKLSSIFFKIISTLKENKISINKETARVKKSKKNVTPNKVQVSENIKNAFSSDPKVLFEKTNPQSAGFSPNFLLCLHTLEHSSQELLNTYTNGAFDTPITNNRKPHKDAANKHILDSLLQWDIPESKQEAIKNGLTSYIANLSDEKQKEILQDLIKNKLT